MTKKPAKAPSRAVAKKTGTAIAVAQPQTPRSFNETMYALATNKDANVGAVQAFLDMRAQETAREARRAFDMQMAEMQPKLPRVGKNGEIVIIDKLSKEVTQRTKYARWEDIHKIVMPVLAQYGFTLTHRVGQATDGKVTVTAVLGHAGHREETTITLMADTTGSKNNVQAIGSSISYGKRYTSSALLNLSFGGEDDDGQAAGGTPQEDDKCVTPKQLDKITAMLLETKSNVSIFLDMLSKIHGAPIESPSDIPAALYDQAIAKLEQKKSMMTAAK